MYKSNWVSFESLWTKVQWWIMDKSMLCPNKSFFHTDLKHFRQLSHSWERYNNVIMGAIASQVTSHTIVYSTVYSDADQIKHQSSVSLAFVRGIHRGPVNSPHKWPETQKMSSVHDVIMKIIDRVIKAPHCILYAMPHYLVRSPHLWWASLHGGRVSCIIQQKYYSAICVWWGWMINSRLWPNNPLIVESPSTIVNK